MTHLGRYVAYLRARQKLSARQLAHLANCSNTFIAHLEQGRRLPTPLLTWQVITALGGDYPYALAALAVDHGVPESEIVGIAPTWATIEAEVSRSDT